jgi:hypothetical protein
MTENYKGHAIILLAGFDEETGAFVPGSSITWASVEGKHMEHSLASTAPCFTLIYALAIAFDEARLWIDRRLEIN